MGAPQLAVIFDMDGVVVDSNPVHREAWRRFFRSRGKPLTDDEYDKRITGRRNDAIFGEYFPGLSPAQREGHAREKEALYRQLYGERGVEPLEGLVPLLGALKARGIPVALATSAPAENVTFVLAATRLLPSFPAIVHGEQVARAKPDPEIFLKAAALVGVPARRCVVIEDSLVGIEAARSAGMKVIALTTTHGPQALAHADLVASGFGDVSVATLEALFPREG